MIRPARTIAIIGHWVVEAFDQRPCPVGEGLPVTTPAAPGAHVGRRDITGQANCLAR
jgi:hypothetical protein